VSLDVRRDADCEDCASFSYCMRDRPGEDERSTMTTNAEATLLTEISDLRSRLRELEDDTKSSVSSAVPGNEEWSNLLKKELAKVENEKAVLEKEYMNHMTSLAVSNQKLVDDLTGRLKKSEETNEILEERLSNQDQEKEVHRLRKVLADEREAHGNEIKQLQENLAQADHEIVESRQEMDYLHEQIMELETDKDSLFQDLTNAKQEIEAVRFDRNQEFAKKEREINRVVEERNDAIIQLDGQREALAIENAALKEQVVKFTVDRANQNSTPVTASERQSLGDEIDRLEQRLELLQAKASEQEKTITGLSESLTDEHNKYQSLKKQLKTLEEAKERDTGINNDKASDDVILLRKQNRKLNDEVMELRRQTADGSLSSVRPQSPDVYQNVTVRDRSDIPKSSIPTGSNHSARPDASPSTGILARVDGSSSVESSANGGKISGLVASLERRVHTTKSGEAIVGAAEVEVGAIELTEMKRELEKERSLVLSLENELCAERQTVASLRADLADVTNTTEASIAGESKDSTLKARLAEKEAQIENLRVKVADLEDALRERETRLNMLRSENEANDAARRDAERRCLKGEDAVRDLKAQLDCVSTMNAMEDEKKSEQEDREVLRLRSQIEALQPELNQTMTEIESVRHESEELKKALHAEQLRTLDLEKKLEEIEDNCEGPMSSSKAQKKLDAVINKLKIQLTETQMSKADLEMESMNRIKEVETEMEALEVEAEEELQSLNKEISMLKQDLANKESDISRLEKEKSQLCSNMNNVSFNRKDEVDELQGELIDMTAKLASQSREIQTLKMKIEDHDTRKGLTEQKLRERIQELEDEITDGHQAQRNQVDKQELERFRSDNLKLRESIREVTAERRFLQDKVEQMSSERYASKSAQSLRERNNDLKNEVDKLTKRLKKMEKSITRFAV
jgi:chromosome segregation protein